MSQKIDEDSDDNGEWPNTASVPSIPLSRKRPRDKEESSNDANSRNENGPGNNTATGLAEFVVDLELTDEVEERSGKNDAAGNCAQILKGVEATEKDVGSEDAQVARHRGERSAKNDPAGKCAQILKRGHATEQDVGSDDAQVADHRKSHEGIAAAAAAAASHPIDSDSEQTSRDDGSANKYSQKLSISKPPSNASGRQWRVRLSELADYSKKYGHCNVPRKYSENTKLGRWVDTQRYQHRLHLEGKISHMTLSRIQDLESLGFEWELWGTAWEDRLSELADYCKIHGHCNVPQRYSENTKLAKWVTAQRSNYRLHRDGKTSPMTTFRIQELECLGFEWDSHGAAWEDRLSELADYRIFQGHCNVPCSYSDNSTLVKWIGRQRAQYRLHLEGKRSQMTTFRIQELESLGFEWTVSAWEDHLSELADYSKIYGHCNVPHNYSENPKLARWVQTQRKQYKLHLEGKTSPMMTLSRIQELESLGFEWDCYGAAWEDRLSELAYYRKIHGHCNVPQRYSDNTKLANWVSVQRNQYRLHVEGKRSWMTPLRIQALVSLGFQWKASISRGKGTRKKPSLDDDATRIRERTVEAPEHMQQHSIKKISAVEKSAAIESASLSNPNNPTGMAKSTSTSSLVEPKE
jgi:hypothetical protein